MSQSQGTPEESNAPKRSWIAKTGRLFKSLFLSLTPYSSNARLKTQIETLRSQLNDYGAKGGDKAAIAAIEQEMNAATKDADADNTESGWWHLAAALRRAQHGRPGSVATQALGRSLASNAATVLRLRGRLGHARRS